jgi:aryl carrier-like protein
MMERSEIAARVKKVIASVLSTDKDQIADEANFIFDLGADSMQSQELVAGFGNLGSYLHLSINGSPPTTNRFEPPSCSCCSTDAEGLFLAIGICSATPTPKSTACHLSMPRTDEPRWSVARLTD